MLRLNCPVVKYYLKKVVFYLNVKKTRSPLIACCNMAKVASTIKAFHVQSHLLKNTSKTEIKNRNCLGSFFPRQFL